LHKLLNECEQAKMLCTASRAKKVIVGLTLVALVTQAINIVSSSVHFEGIWLILFRLVVPVTVLIINAIVVREVCRRASRDAGTNLGLHRHQSTSSNSAVPTVMLVTTSLVYVLLYGPPTLIKVLHWSLKKDVLIRAQMFVWYPMHFVFAYNFYVYL